MRKRIMDLSLFDEEGNNGSENNTGNQQNNNSGQSFSYDQLDEIATARADRATRSAVRNFLQQKGLSEQEANDALTQYLENREKNKPDVSAIEKERDDALKELQGMKNSNLLRDKGVKTEDMDYVIFKVSQLVTDKKDFKAAADEFLKKNPRFTGAGYRMSGSSDGNANGSGNSSMSINDAIRQAARR